MFEVVLSEDQGNFKFGKTELPDEAKPRLDQMITQIKQDPKSVFFEIEGHTDNVGDKATNEQIGLERAEAVKRYLYEQHQIPLHKMNVISYGEDKPVAPNKTGTAARRIAASSSRCSRKPVSTVRRGSSRHRARHAFFGSCLSRLLAPRPPAAALSCLHVPPFLIPSRACRSVPSSTSGFPTAPGRSPACAGCCPTNASTSWRWRSTPAGSSARGRQPRARRVPCCASIIIRSTERDVIVTAIPNAPGALAPVLKLVSRRQRQCRVRLRRRRAKGVRRRRWSSASTDAAPGLWPPPGV